MANSRKQQTARQGRSVYLIAAFAVLFALRSLVPVGFMPDQASLNEGKIRIEICGPDGVSYSYINLASDYSPQRGGSHTSSAYSCIFCVLSAQGLMSGSSADFLHIQQLVLSDSFILQPTEFIPAQFAGPPLGARAPPFLS